MQKAWPYLRMFAHRGGGIMGPENTMMGMQTGLSYGYHAMEVDAMLSKDGGIILMHDEKFGRTILDDNRSVPELTFARNRALEAGRWLAPRFAGAHPASLERLILWARPRGVQLNIEIKPACGHEYETGVAVAKLVQRLYADVLTEKTGTQEGASAMLPLFSSFKAEALEGAMDTAPRIPRGFLVDRVPEDWFRTLHRLHCVSFHCNHKKMTARMITKAKDAGYWLFAYTVNDPHRAQELFAMGFDGMCTDRIDWIRPA